MKVFADKIKVRISKRNYTGFRVSPTSGVRCPYMNRKGTQKHREENHIKMDQRLEFCCQKSRNKRSNQEERGKEGFSPRVCGGSVTCPNRDFRLLAPTALKEYIFLVFGHPVCTAFYERFRKLTLQPSALSLSHFPSVL